MHRFAGHFFKRKTGKKKADYEGGLLEKPKGNGISPSGWVWEARADPLCRSLLAGRSEGRPPYFGCLFTG
ncbi:hypothetical protein CMT75_17540 [Elizabethkingia anophelis]|nr:hypothetical protein [Elizabethkingia anophelis]